MSSATNAKEEDDMIDFSHVLPQAQMDDTVRQWLQDDLPSFDVGGLVVGSVERTATLYLKSPGVFAGKPFVEAIFERVLDCQVTWSDEAVEGRLFDEASSSHKLVLATISGPAQQLLQGERTALNTLSRCSGVATAARTALTMTRQTGWKGWLAGTRKTTPGFRVVEKYGLLVGGVATHRLDLSQMCMLKDNHVQSSGSITAAVTLARQAAGFSQKIEVECQTLEEAVEAAQAGADIVMLDNFTPAQLETDAASFKRDFPRVLVEASGGITLETLPDYCLPCVDIISQGALTQGYACLDYSLKIVIT